MTRIYTKHIQEDEWRNEFPATKMLHVICSVEELELPSPHSYAAIHLILYYYT